MSMPVLVTLVALSGAGKSEVFDRVITKYPHFSPMNTYTSRLPRFEGEGGYEFHSKDFFKKHQKEFVELATYPPHSDPKEENIHYYGKHKSQFDGQNYIMTMDEVGVQTLDKIISRGKLKGYKILKLFVDCDDEVRLQRINHDKKRMGRDAKRKL